jgi:hypothetical protein
LVDEIRCLWNSKFQYRSSVSFSSVKIWNSRLGAIHLYSDSHSGLTYETRKTPCSRHLSYRGGPSASFSRSFTGQNPPCDLQRVYTVRYFYVIHEHYSTLWRLLSSSNCYLKIQFVPQKNISCSLQGLINSVYANICSFWGSQKHINTQCKKIQSF